MNTNKINFGGKTLQSLVFDGGKSEFFYFHAGSDNEWFNTNNWYTNSSFLTLANRFPSENDIVIITDENVSNSTNSIITVAYLSVYRSGYGAYWGNSLTLNFGAGLNIVCLYGANLTNYSDYVGGYINNYANITSPSMTMILSNNFGELNSNVIFTNDSSPWYDYGNYGIINGNVSFSGNGQWWSRLRNYGTINGNVNLYNFATNNSTINGDVNLYDYSINDTGATINGITNFYNSSYSYGTVNGDTYFNGYIENWGTINGNATFNDGYNYNVVNGNAIFNGSATNGYWATGAAVNGNATFNQNSTNYGNVSGDAHFYDNSQNRGSISSASSFYGSSYNLGSVNSAVFYDFASNGNQYEPGTVNNNAVFNNSSNNQTYGTVSGDATFNGSSNNYGTVIGILTCNTTGVCGTPPVPSSVNSDLALLMHFDGLTFEDSSLHRLAITANGSPVISTSQSKFGGGSVYFDGEVSSGSSYLSIDNAGQLSGDFTVEFWFNANSYGSLNRFTFMGTRTGSSGDNGWIIAATDGSYSFDNESGFGDIFVHSDASVLINGATTWSLNIWNHLALCRSGNMMKLFLNGISIGAVVWTGNFSESTLYVGKEIRTASGANSPYNGYIDELRIVKGVALYTSNFTPSTTPYQDPEPPNPSLLMHFDGSSFVDSSLNNHTITNNGASLSSGESKFGGSSGYFDGSSQLTIPLSSSLEFNTGDFTIETWVYLTSLSSDTFVTSPINNGGWFFGFDGNLYLGFGRKFVAWDLNAPDTIPTNTWIHIAATRQQGTLRLFINGMKSAEMPNNLIDYSLSSADMVIGSHYNSMWLSGYIDELRIIKGKALYTSNFLPPTAPTPNPIVPDLLLSFEGSDGSTNFVDSSPNNASYVYGGSVQIDNALKRVGGSSAISNNTNSYITYTVGQQLEFGTGDWTVEFWLYQNGTMISPNCNVSSCCNTSPYWHWNLGAWQIGYGNSPNTGVFAWTPDGSPNNQTIQSIDFPISQNSWCHIAITRNGTSINAYVNGILKNTLTVPSDAVFDSDGSFGIFQYDIRTNSNLGATCSIDELRIVKGTALYTSNFNPF